jgi:chromosome segregation ATPase
MQWPEDGILSWLNACWYQTRTSTDPEDVRDSANRLADKNRQAGQELDRMLMMRKQKEAETAKVEEQIENCYREMQTRINELEPGKLRAYNDLLTRQRDLQERVHETENRLNEINSRIGRLEEDDRSNSHRKEYAKLERQVFEVVGISVTI